MHNLETDRLKLRRLTLDDAAFIFELVNDPSFVENIGDKGVRSLVDAERYLQEGPLASYARHGLGLLCVELKETDTPIGICGLLKRDHLADVDVGFAFLPRFWSRGYATESARAALEFGFNVLNLRRIVAITSPGNTASGKVLEKIGLRHEGLTHLPGESSEIKLFAIEI